jgi:hypothetical protein
MDDHARLTASCASMSSSRSSGCIWHRAAPIYVTHDQEEALVMSIGSR